MRPRELPAEDRCSSSRCISPSLSFNEAAGVTRGRRVYPEMLIYEAEAPLQ